MGFELSHLSSKYLAIEIVCIVNVMDLIMFMLLYFYMKANQSNVWFALLIQTFSEAVSVPRGGGGRGGGKRWDGGTA